MSQAETRRTGFLRAFLASVLGTGLSRILGAVRDVTVASFLGAGAASDAFFLAFTLPSVFRRFVADEGLTGAMLPALAEAERDGGEQEMRRLANSILGVLLVANALLLVVGIAGARELTLMFAYSWKDDPAQLERTIELTRLMFPFVTMVSLVSFCEGLLNHRRHFFVPKVAPGIVSAGIAGGAILLGTSFQEPAHALVVGLLIGGAAHVLVNVPFVLKRWGPVGLRLDAASPRVRRVLVELGKVVAIGVFAQVNLLVLRQLTTSLPQGTLTHYWNATRLVDLSQGIVAVAIGSALLPDITQSVTEGAWKQFRADLGGALRLAGFLLVPVAVTLLAFALPITAVLFRHGRYSFADVGATATALQILVPFLLSVAGINILKKVYFALNDRTTLFVVGAAGVAGTAALGWALVGPWGLNGVCAALSTATLAQLALYVAILYRRLGTHLGLGDTALPLARMVLATAPTAGILWAARTAGTWDQGPTPDNIAVLAGGLGLAALAYLSSARVLGVPEVQLLLGRVLRRFR